MKTMFVGLVMLFVVSIALGQNQPVAPSQDQTETQLLGRGRGGAPFAWNDRNKDGICNVTGQAVGQGRPIGYGRGRAGGRGCARGDRNGDGICDFTGQPVRAGRGFGGGKGGGRWAGAGDRSSAPMPEPTARQPRQ